jgi:starch phosphorylase
MLLADYDDYVHAASRGRRCTADPSEWARQGDPQRRGDGPFSSDRTIREYVDKVWTAPARR